MGEEGEGWRRGIGLWLGKGIWLVGLKVVGAESQPAISRKEGIYCLVLIFYFFFWVQVILLISLTDLIT